MGQESVCLRVAVSHSSCPSQDVNTSLISSYFDESGRPAGMPRLAGVVGCDLALLYNRFQRPMSSTGIPVG